MGKLVSVIIPTYKRHDTVSRAVKSVLNQSYRNIEIIVVDDNGVDTLGGNKTKEALSEFINMNNFYYIQHKHNINGSAARNTGFKKSIGDYIMFLDDDDEFINNKIKSQVKTLENLDVTWAATYTNYIRKKEGKVVMYGTENRQGELVEDQLMRNLFIQAGSNLMIRRNVVEELNGFNENFIRNQDIEFLSRLLLKYKIAHTDELGLVVNLYEKDGLFDFVDITKKYVETFDPIIRELPEESQKKISVMINLQLIRHYILSKHNIIKAFEIMKINNIRARLVISYINHLLYRKITKKDYGFKFNL